MKGKLFMDKKTDLVTKWIKYAKDDLVVAKLIIDSKIDSYQNVVFHSQQATEKILKAYIIDNDIPFRRIHDLKTLISMIESCFQIDNSLYHRIEIFVKFNIETRYPDLEENPTIDEAKKAIAEAEWILNYFKSLLNK